MGQKCQFCRVFLTKVHKINIKRIRVVQNKVLQNTSFIEKSGKHGKQPKLEVDVWQ